MARPKVEREDTHTLVIQLPMAYWQELLEHFKKRKSYNSYAEMIRTLTKLGLAALEEQNGRRETVNKAGDN
jgi:hypothetical protein